MADNIGIFTSSVLGTAALTANATGNGPGSNGLHATTSSRNDSAVYGEHQHDGIGVFGRGGLNGGEGVFGQNASASSSVYGKNLSTGAGVTGESDGGTGVRGISHNGGAGVYGRCNLVLSNHSSLGDAAGVFGENNLALGIGVHGKAEDVTGVGVFGESRNGVGAYGFSPGGTGVEGASYSGDGVVGIAYDRGRYAVYGVNVDGIGVRGLSRTVGIYAGNLPANLDAGDLRNGAYLGGWALAGDFYGDVQVNGHLSKASGSFLIDHPLDPANKLLSHAFVESPEMKNIYDGVVTLDSAGEATVTLPSWFHALNTDFRYQVTSLGTASPNLHVAEEIEESRFRIAGGVPAGRVSWQVTGIRKDPWALAHPIEVEKEKSATEQGHYLHPQLYGEGMDRSIEHARYSTLWSDRLPGPLLDGESGSDRRRDPSSRMKKHDATI